MGRGRIYEGVASLVATVTGLSAAAAHSSASLEELAQTEFAKAGAAMREQLERDAAGDPSGARLAADGAELHRNHYRHLMREMTHAHPADAAASSVAAPRDPFVPDATFWRADEASPIRLTISGRRTQDASESVTHAPWDLYGHHAESVGSESTGAAPRDAAGARGTDDRAVRRADLYSTGRIASAWTASRKSLDGGSSRERSNEPFFVDREKVAADAVPP